MSAELTAAQLQQMDLKALSELIVADITRAERGDVPYLPSIKIAAMLLLYADHLVETGAGDRGATVIPFETWRRRRVQRVAR